MIKESLYKIEDGYQIKIYSKNKEIGILEEISIRDNYSGRIKFLELDYYPYPLISVGFIHSNNSPDNLLPLKYIEQAEIVILKDKQIKHQIKIINFFFEKEYINELDIDSIYKDSYYYYTAKEIVD